MSSAVLLKCGPRAIIFSEHDMIFTFILAVSLAFISYFLGLSVVKVAIYTGVAKVALMLATCWFIHYLYRRFTRARRGGVRRIPRL
jgi:hypothetical protein